jgi:hypothetical protein
MPWYVWLALGLLIGLAVAYLALVSYLARAFRR